MGWRVFAGGTGLLFFLITILVIAAGCAQTPPTPTPAIPPTIILPPTTVPSPTPAPTDGPTLVPASPTDLPTPSPIPTVQATPTLMPAGVPSPTSTPLGMVAPIGVMVDNDPHARPQSGLNSADVVYEIVAEFNLTRFLALYFVNAPEVVGSIRSTRPYFALLMTEYGGGVVHCLDVPGTKSVLDQGNVFNFDLCRGQGEEAAIRTSVRSAPFNLYTNARLLQSELRQRVPRQAAALQSRAPLPIDATSSSGLTIAYPEGHRVVWSWNGQSYERAQDGQPHLAASGDVVSTDVVVVQRAFTRPARYFGDGGYHLVDLVGSGTGLIVAGGKSTPVRWSRTSVFAPTSFVGASGVPVPFPPGRVFIQVVPTNSQIDVGR